MDELIYQFLLQAGYPRAAIVSDASLLERGPNASPPEDATTYAVVDPETADRLAAIDVVGAIDADTLRERASRVAQYARRLGGQQVQGFVIRVDTKGRNEAEQVQFYRVWPGTRMQQLSAKTFPDLDGLRVAHLLALELSLPPTPEIIDVEDDEDASDESAGPAGGGGALRWIPAMLLALLAVADWYVTQSRGAGLLSVVQALLVIGAAALLTLVANGRNRG